MNGPQQAGVRLARVKPLCRYRWLKPGQPVATMNDQDDGNIEIAVVPGEWAIKKLLGPVLSECGEDLKRAYAAGRDRLISAATRKIEDLDDGKSASLRVTRDVLWHGTTSEDEVCAEYFGGILASSRTNDGKDDSSIQFVDVTKSLSSTQLRLHYLIYHALNKMLIEQGRQVNVAQGNEINDVSIWMLSTELEAAHAVNRHTDFNALWRNGLLHEYKLDTHAVGENSFPYSMARPTSFGVMLYAAAHNRRERWLQFPNFDFGSFESITPLPVFAADLVSLRKLLGLGATDIGSSSGSPAPQ